MKSVSLLTAEKRQSGLIKQMMQRYLAGFAEFTEIETAADGQFTYRYLDHYWQSRDRHPYLISFQDHLAGFCLVRDVQDPAQGLKYRELAEFFIDKPYRRQGIGEAALSQLLNLYPKTWRIACLEANRVGSVFWKRVLQPFAGVTEEYHLPTGEITNKSGPENVYWIKLGSD